MPFTSETTLRVRYAETDAMGIVHHAVYPIWMELARSDFLRELGSPYPQWEAMGLMMAVSELRLTYRGPARYDELITVRAWIRQGNRRKVVFGYEISREGTRLVEGESVHLVIGPDGRNRTLPDAMLALVTSAL